MSELQAIQALIVPPVEIINICNCRYLLTGIELTVIVSPALDKVVRPSSSHQTVDVVPELKLAPSCVLKSLSLVPRMFHFAAEGCSPYTTENAA